VPTGGESDQDTFGLAVPLSDTLNCIDCPPESVADDGNTTTEIVGLSVTTAAAVLVGSAALAAVTVMV